MIDTTSVKQSMKTLVLDCLKDLLLGEQEDSIFCDPPVRQALYINADRSREGCYFHSWDHSSNTFVPYLQTCLKGQLLNLEIVTVENSEGEASKLRVRLKHGDQEVVVQSGAETLFAKGILFTVANCSIETLQNLIYLEAHPGDPDKLTSKRKNKLLFSRMYDYAGNSLYFERPETINWTQTIEQAIENVNAANERVLTSTNA